MKLIPRPLHLITFAGFLVVALWVLGVWSKHDFCRGWADHYAGQAIQLRTDAANPELTANERKEYLVAANLQEAVSREYRTVAWQPWKPYPSYPLVSNTEKWNASQVQ